MIKILFNSCGKLLKRESKEQICRLTCKLGKTGSPMGEGSKLNLYQTARNLHLHQLLTQGRIIK